jgi:hypothetical protein
MLSGIFGEVVAPRPSKNKELWTFLKVSFNLTTWKIKAHG